MNYNIKTIINYIGLLAPIILFILTLFLLRNTKTYMLFFLYGTLFNNIINIILKLFIKEPRPDKDNKAIELGILHGARINFDKFGMPSGHAQNCAFITLFSTMVFNNPIITCFYTTITMICVLQRYLNHNHTILQLLVGLIIGAFIGYITYILGNKYIVGNTQTKPDENGPL